MLHLISKNPYPDPAIPVLIATGKVTKLPGSAAVIDGHEEVTTVLTVKPGYGTLRSVTLATGASRQQIKMVGGQAIVSVAAGVCVVAELSVSS